MAAQVDLEYAPRQQFMPFHERSTRWSVIVAHRRAGKTVACINELITRALYTPKKNARYAYIAPFYRQAKDVAWEYLKEYSRPLLKPGTRPRESELRVTLLNGAQITLYGADNPDALRGLYFDGVVLDEYGDCRPSLWAEVILPTLSDRQGWAVFIGTPKGHNHFYEVRNQAIEDPSWFYSELRASQTGIIAEAELEQIKLQQTEDQYLQEYECSFDAAVVGTYYASLISQAEQEGRISDDPAFDYDPEHPVFVSSDLGYTDSSAWWFWQLRPDGILLFDYEEDHGKALDHYFELFRYQNYPVETYWLPHDARAKTLQTGRSTIEQFVQAGLPAKIYPHLAIQHGIDAARLLLPTCYFRKTPTKDGVDALRAYRRGYSEVSKAFTDKPFHDWSSHGADAFRGFALVTQARQAGEVKPKPEFHFKPKPYCLEDLYEEKNNRISVAGRTYGKMRV